MITTQEQEAEVSCRFDALQSRFKQRVSQDDYRLIGILDALGPLVGKTVLDLGCGKGRFARETREKGAEVVGLDLSQAMLRSAFGIERVRASARRLPFASATFHAAIAVEVFQHLTPSARAETISEAARVLKPGGVLAIVDRNASALDIHRPWLPGLAVKRLDELRGRWMYPPGGPVRERWFRAASLSRELGREFASVDVIHLLAPAEDRRLVFRILPMTRRMVLWVAHVGGCGGAHV